MYAKSVSTCAGEANLIAFAMVCHPSIHISHIHVRSHTHAHIFAALQCDCNDQVWFSDCRYNDWTCTVRGDTGVCTTRARLLSNGTISRETKCLDMRLNPFHCSGRYNTDTDVWACCNDTDYCNSNLTPTLNLPAATVHSLPSSNPVSSSVVLSTPTSTPLPANDISPSQTTSTATSSSAVDGLAVNPTFSVQVPSEPFESSSFLSAVVTPTLEMLTPTQLPTPPGEENMCDCIVKAFLMITSRLHELLYR